MSDVPPEVWANIFTHLEPRDLKNVSMVSRYFNDIVSGFPALIDRFSLEIDERKLTSEKMKMILKSGRKYTSLSFIGIKNFGKVLKIVRKFKDSVNFLAIDECRLSRQDLQNLFEVVGENLETLKLRFDQDVESPEASFITTKLILENTGSLFLRRLQLTISPDSIHILNQILKTLLNLKDLEIILRGQYERIFHPQDFEAQKFRLEKFLFRNYFTGLIYADNGVLEFVESQGKTLECLELSGVTHHCSTQKTLNSMEKLECLRYFCQNFAHPNVVLTNCSSLKTLYLTTQNVGKSLEEILAELPNLECLHLDYWNFQSPLTFIPDLCPKIKKLWIYPYEDAMFKNSKFPSLEEVSIGTTDCMNLIKNHDLQNLTISKGAEVEDKDLRKLLENSGKLRHLEIQNGGKLSGNFRDFQFLINEHLEIMKIWNYQLDLESSKFLVKLRPKFRLSTSKFEKTRHSFLRNVH